MGINVQRREIGYVRQGLGVRVTITIDGDSLMKDERREAADCLASNIMTALSGSRFINAPLSKIKVR